MSALAARFAAAAETLVGTRFRLHGRDPATGLDCVGLVACALDRCERKAHAPHGYGLRNVAIDHHLAFAAANGFGTASGQVQRGDLLLTVPGPAQHHLLVALGPAEVIHAHAGLRRVIRQTGAIAGPLLHHWRLAAPL